MNKIISMNHSGFGDRDMQTIPLTPLERLDARRKVAESLQKQSGWQDIVEKGWIMEGEVFVALIDICNTDPAHILNAELEPNWDENIVTVTNWKVEAEALERDAQDWQDQVTEMRNQL
jgi:hypothetical protein